jgi:3-oxoacyl-[acyl-carrier-protein] synthase II
MKAVVTNCDLFTPYGRGVAACWQGLLSGRTAVRAVDRFETRAFTSRCAALAPGLDPAGSDSLCMQMLAQVLEGARDRLPADTFVILATTAGEVDLLERSLLRGQGADDESRPDRLLAKVLRMCAPAAEGIVVSAACASSSVALAQAAGWIADGERDCVLVAACDSVTEFVFAGFSALMALDSRPARPFDSDRKGLSLGEAAGWALLMSERRARAEGRPIIGRVDGWGLSNDANHMTGPSRDGQGLAAAIEKALGRAGRDAPDVACVSAHGTGTVYNDAMEMKAFRRVFGERAAPTYSVKGAVGHTLGAAGLVETLVALQALHERTVPPTIGLAHADDDARGWVSTAAVRLAQPGAALLTNAGFGGINAALVLAGGEAA